MKKLLIIAALIAASQAQADDECEQLGDLAWIIALQRDQGVELPDIQQRIEQGITFPPHRVYLQDMAAGVYADPQNPAAASNQVIVNCNSEGGVDAHH